MTQQLFEIRKLIEHFRYKKKPWGWTWYAGKNKHPALSSLLSVNTRALTVHCAVTPPGTGGCSHLTPDHCHWHFPSRQLSIKTDAKSSSAEVNFWPLSKQQPHHEDFGKIIVPSKSHLIPVCLAADAAGRVPGAALHRALRVRPGPRPLHCRGAPGGKTPWTRWTQG